MPKGKVLALQPPSPPFLNVMRDYAGEYGVAGKSDRSDYGHEGAVVPNMSLVYGTSVLAQAGYEVRFIDGQAEQLSLDETLRRVSGFAPEVIVSALSLPSLDGDLKLLEAIAERLPSARIVCLGTVCKKLYTPVLDSPCVTAAIRDDAEVVLPGLVRALLAGGDLAEVKGIAYRKPDGSLAVTAPAEPVRDLDSLPMPPYHLLPMDRYWHGAFGSDCRYMEVLDSRGCPHRCGSYCPYPFAFGRKVLLKSPERVVDEVELLHREFGVDGFIFRAQNFTVPRQHAEGICEGILARGLKIRWLCETRLDAVDRSLLGLMKRAGCERIHYGLESGDPERFAAVGKPGCRFEGIAQAVAETQQAGIHARLNVVLGLPGESWGSVRRTIRTLREIRPDSVLSAIITPYPGTLLYQEAKEKGLLLTEEWSEYTGFHPVMRTETMSASDLLAAQSAVENCLYQTWIARRAARKAFRMLKGWTGSLSQRGAACEQPRA